jgi:hypothetical protein
MIPSGKSLPALDEETVQRIASDFQARFLMFRLQHYREYRPKPIDLSPLSPRMQDLVGALLVPLRDVKDAMAPIWDALEEQFLQAEVERANEPEALVVTALFGYCHDEDSSTVLVGEIATWVNACRRNLGEEAALKPRAVGAILKSLGFTTGKVDSFGRGLRLTAEVQRKIHQLMQSYNLKSDPTDPRISGCVLCKEKK